MKALTPSTVPLETATNNHNTPAPLNDAAVPSISVNEVLQPRWARLEYKWKLDEFWELRSLACVEALEDENGGLIWSQRFGDKEKGLWQLKIYPYGDHSETGRTHVSLFLSLLLKSLDVPKAYVVFGCYLLDEDGNKIPNSGKSFTRQKFSEGSSSWGWSQFLKVDDKSLQRVVVPPNNSLIVKCEIEVFVGTMASPGRKMDTPQTWEEDLKRYLNSPSNYNVALKCGHRIIRANRTVLCGRSKWFANKFAEITSTEPTSFIQPQPNKKSDLQSNASMTKALPTSSGITYASFGLFTSDSLPASPGGTNNPFEEPRQPTEDQTYVAENGVGCEQTLVISHMSPEVLENCVAFMNTDDCDYFTEGMPLVKTLELLQASKYLEIKALTLTIMRRLTTSIVNKTTALAVQDVAQRLGLTELSDYCASYLLHCARELSRNEILQTLTPKNY